MRTSSGGQVSLSGFPHQAGQGSQGVKDIGEEDCSFGPQQPKDGKAFEAPGLEGCIAAFHGIAGAVIEGLPGRRTHGDIADQAQRAVGEGFGNIDHPSMPVLLGLIGTFGGRVADLRQGNTGRKTFEAGFVAGPFLAGTLAVIAEGGEGVAERAKRTAAVVVTAGHPLLVVPVGGVGPAVDHPAGCQGGIHGMQEEIEAVGRISGNGIDMQVRVIWLELQQKCGGRQVFMQIGRAEIIQQGQAEATAGIRQA